MCVVSSPLAVTPSMASRGKFCCAINCYNYQNSLDPRTGKFVKMHSFPDAVKDKERCQKWIINLRRADLNLTNVKHKCVCSVHFETKAYTCPSDIATSRLFANAIPTLINCPNLPQKIIGKRKHPATRTSMLTQVTADSEEMDQCSVSTPSPVTDPEFSIPAPKKEKCDLSDEVKTLQIELAKVKHQNKLLSQQQIELAKVKHQNKLLSQLQIELAKVKYQNKLLSQQNTRLKGSAVKKQKEHIHLLQKLSKARQTRLDNILGKLPPIPQSLFKLFLHKKKKKNVWKTNKEALQLCQAIYFRSPSAYRIFRSSGFILPHPRTLRRQYSDTCASKCRTMSKIVRNVEIKNVNIETS